MDTDSACCDGGLTGGFWYWDGSWSRLIFRLLIRAGIVYACLAYWCWEEIRFRSSAVELTAKVNWVRTAPRTRHRRNHRQVRYSFLDPGTGVRRINTVVVPPSGQPEGDIATIQYLPGDFPQSRLKSQARPHIVTAFYTINAVLLSIIVGYCAYLGWEVNHDTDGRLSPKQRGIERFHRRRKLEREMRRAWR